MSNRDFGYDIRLPENIREVFMWLCQDVASLQRKWDSYLKLFSSQENTSLLSELAQGFFQVIEESLRNDMTMAICRLSDPPKSMGKDNLSLRTLVEQCDERARVSDLLKDFVVACESVRQYRNKRVGHNDLNTTIKPKENLLPGIDRNQIDTILQLAGDILNTIYQQFTDGELYFAPLQIGGVDDLIHWLEIAREHEETRRIALNKSIAGSQACG